MVAFNRLRDHRREILSPAERHGPSNVRVFRSILNPDAATPHDVDSLVNLQPGRSLLDHVALWQDLEELLGCPVDVVDKAGLSPCLKDYILAVVRKL